MKLGDSTEQSLQQLVELQRTQIAQNQQMMNVQQMNSQQQKAGAMNGVSYMPPIVSFAPQTQIQQQQFMGYAQQAASGPNRYGFFDTMYVNNSRISNQSRQIMAADYGARLSNATIAGVGALGSSLVDLGISTAIPGFLGSAIAGTMGGAVVGGFASIGLDQVKQSQAYNKYLLRNSYMMVNPLESTNERDIAGFNTQQRHDASQFLRGMNTQFYMKDEETMQLLQKFTEGGMLKDTKDLNDFKEKMKNLTKTVKEGALLLNETYGEIADMMSEMRKVGIADKNFDPLMSKSRVVGSMLGISGSSALNLALGNAININQGTEISNDILTGRIQNSLLYTDRMYSDLKAKKQAGTLSQDELRQYNAITDVGGVDKMAPALMSFQNQFLSVNNGMASKDAIAFFDYNSKTNDFTFNRDKFNSFISGNTSLDDISHQATQTLNSMSKAGQEKWMQKGQTYMLNNMDFDQMNNFDTRFLGAMRKLNPTYASMSNEQLMNQLGIGDSPERTTFSAYLDAYQKDSGKLLRQMDAYSMRENVLAGMNSRNPGLLGEVKNQWEKFKDVVGNQFQPISDKITDWTQNFQDLMYGKKYTSADLASIAEHDYTAKGIGRQISDTNSTISNVKSALADLGKQGLFVDSSLVNSLNGIQDFNNGRSGWENTYIKEERRTFNSSTGLEDIKLGDSNLGNAKEYKLLKDQSDKNNLSETIVAALMKFGQQNGGKNIMGMTDSMLSEASKALGKKAYGAGEDGLESGTAYLGKLMTLYGGNQNLALSAFFSSQSSIDQALRAGGINVDDLRNGGNINSLQGVDWLKYVKDKDVQNKVNGASGIENSWTGNNHDGTHFVVAGTQVQGGPVYQQGYDYARGGKNSVADTNNGVDIYDLIHYYAKQNSISPNALASMVGIESGGNINSVSPVGAQGLMQMMPGTFEQYVGREITLPDGTKKTISASDIRDPYVNAYAGSDYYSRQLKTFYNNPYIAYAAYNAGPGTGTQIANYLKEDYGMNDASLSGATAQQIIDTIQKHWAYGGDHGINGETDKAVGIFSGIYNQGLIMPTSTEITHRATSSASARYFDKSGTALTQDQVSQYIKDASDGYNAYQYDPTALLNLHKAVNKSGAADIIGGSTKGMNYNDAMQYLDAAIKGAKGELNGDQYNSEHGNTILSWVSKLQVKSDEKALANFNSQKKQMQLDMANNLARISGMARADGETDEQFIYRVDANTADEFNKNVSMMEEYNQAKNWHGENQTTFGKLSTTQRGQILDYVQSIIKSGKADQLGVSPTDKEVKNRILAGDAYFSDSDKKSFADATGKSSASYSDYLKKAQDTSWFTNVKADEAKGKIYVGDTTDEILKKIDSQKQSMVTDQLDAQEALLQKYQRTIGGRDSHFSPQDKEKIDNLIKNPGKSSSDALDAMIAEYTSKDPGRQNPEIQKQIDAMKSLSDTMKEKFDKNTDALIEAAKQFESIRDTTKGFGEVSRLMSDALSQMPEQSQAIKDFISTLDRDSKKLEDASKQGPQQQESALDKAKTDIANTVSAIVTEDRNSNRDDLRSLAEQLGKTKGVSDDQMKELVDLVDKSEGRVRNTDGTSTFDAQNADNTKKQKEAQAQLMDELTSMIVKQTDNMNKTADDNQDAAGKLSGAGDNLSKAVGDYVKGVNTAISTLKTGVDQAKDAAGIATTTATHDNQTYFFGMVSKIQKPGQ